MSGHTLVQRSESRVVKITPNINPYSQGSVLAEFGNTKVHITAVVEESVPPFLRGKAQGWVTAEYAMLPMATHERSQRERKGAGGRTQEIQRLIGRSLRSVVDLKKLGERSITLDCDVLVADGGTRTTSITGAFVALKLAINELMKKGLLKQDPIKEMLAAISVGVNKEGKILVDLNYTEDSSCQTDMNIVMTESGRFIEVQGTAEGEPFSKAQLDAMLSSAEVALKNIFDIQKRAIGQ